MLLKTEHLVSIINIILSAPVMGVYWGRGWL